VAQVTPQGFTSDPYQAIMGQPKQDVWKRVMQETLVNALPMMMGMAGGISRGAVEAGKRYYKVAISKAYFPKGSGYTKLGAFFEKPIKVLAKNRTEAAEAAWMKHGDRWLSQMKPHTSRLPRKVSLDVDDPVAGVGGYIGRLMPVNIYKEGIK